jgi:hypothetical protein
MDQSDGTTLSPLGERISLGIHERLGGLHVGSFELPNETMNFSRIILVTQALSNEN